MTMPAADVLAKPFAKTDAGRSEIQRKTWPLARTARNLLLIIDPGRSAAQWLALVQGATPADLQALLDAGLVAAVGVATAAPAAAAAPRMSLAQALETKSYPILYARITAEARPRLGLLKGYKLILDVERCSGPAELRALAQRFIEQVRSTDGDSAALALAKLLLAPD